MLLFLTHSPSINHYIITPGLALSIGSKAKANKHITVL